MVPVLRLFSWPCSLHVRVPSIQARDRLNRQLANVSGQLDDGTRRDPTSTAADPVPQPPVPAAAAAASPAVPTPEAAPSAAKPQMD